MKVTDLQEVPQLLAEPHGRLIARHVQHSAAGHVLDKKEPWYSAR
jgi:hypothetical protein